MKPFHTALISTVAVGAVAAVAYVGVTQFGAPTYAELTRTLPGSDTDVFDGCPMTGDRRATAELDKLKNRHTDPLTIDPAVTFEKLSQAPVDDSTLSEGVGATITGFLTDAHLSGPESCECHLNPTGPDAGKDFDFHVYIGPAADSPKSSCIIVEVTPRMRRWSLAQLQALVGKQVRVTGWCMADSEHARNSVVDLKAAGKLPPVGPDGRYPSSVWRASCQEIHPVSKIEAMQ